MIYIHVKAGQAQVVNQVYKVLCTNRYRLRRYLTRAELEVTLQVIQLFYEIFDHSLCVNLLQANLQKPNGEVTTLAVHGIRPNPHHCQTYMPLSWLGFAEGCSGMLSP
jgi:hypothetical protein